MNCFTPPASPDHWKRRWRWYIKRRYYFEKLLTCEAVTLWATGIYTLVEWWKDCCFIVLLLSAMPLIKFSTVVVWRLFEDKCFSACSCVLTRAKSERSINVPDASSSLDFIFLYRCVCGKGNWCEDNSCWHLETHNRAHTLAQNTQAGL